MENLEASSDKLFVNADVDVQVTAEQTQLDLEEVVNEEVKEEEKVLGNDSQPDGEKEENKETSSEEHPKLSAVEFNKVKKEAMDKLGEYEAKEKEKTVLSGRIEEAQAKLDVLIDEVMAANFGLVNEINGLKQQLEEVEQKQEDLKKDLLPLQEKLFYTDEKEKTLLYNKIQSTFVEATVKNQFDLKKFREEETSFWEEHLDVLRPYAKITDVAEYLKITIKK